MDIVKHAKSIFETEIKGLSEVKNRLSTEMIEIANFLLKLEGKVVITGIGKSGIIGKKIAATLASTGTLAIFMHSAEGLHGDLGMIDPKDCVIAISNSGNSDEVLSILPSIKAIGAKIIAMTGNKNSKLGIAADYILDIGVTSEGCPLNLSPMSSATATLVMGDALASVLIKLRDFKPEKFAVYHPGGSLGRRLLMKVENLMQSGEALPMCKSEDIIDEVLIVMNKKRLGTVCVMEKGEMVGIITEGDVRRALKRKEEFFSLKAKNIMTTDFISISYDKMAIEALEVMEERESQISVLPVFNEDQLCGIVRIHDLLTAVGR